MKIEKGEPAPFTGVLISNQDYDKMLNDQKLLSWISEKLEKINKFIR